MKSSRWLVTYTSKYIWDGLSLIIINCHLRKYFDDGGMQFLIVLNITMD